MVSTPVACRRGTDRTGRYPPSPRTPHLMGVALAAARAGHFVFPLWPKTKMPAMHAERDCPGTGDCVHGHLTWEQRATREPAVIRTWWRSLPLNVGIACGPSRLVVLDLDPAHGQQPPAAWAGALHGRDVLARLARQHGQPYPDDTLIIRTPHGGVHQYYRAPREPVLRNTVARAGWRIDSRGVGGFIVAAGSTLPAGRYRVIRQRPIAPLPDWLIPLLTPPPMPQTEPDMPPQRAGQPLAEARKQAYLRTVSGNAARAGEGSRHDTLRQAACTLGRLVAGGDVTDGEARAALYTAAAQLEQGGFPAWEADRVINDGLTFGARYPRRLAERVTPITPSRRH